MDQNAIAAGASPRTPLGRAYSTPLNLLAGFRGGKGVGNGGKGREGRQRSNGGEMKGREMGRG